MLKILKKIQVSTLHLNTIDVEKAKGCFLNDHTMKMLEYDSSFYMERFYWLYLFVNKKNFRMSKIRTCPWCKNDLSGLEDIDKKAHFNTEHLLDEFDYYEYRNQMDIMAKYSHLHRKGRGGSIFLTHSGCLLCEVPYGYTSDRKPRECKEKTIKNRFRSFEQFGIDIPALLNEDEMVNYFNDNIGIRKFGGLLVK